MNRLLLFLLLISATVSQAQKVKIINMSKNYTRQPDVAGFDYLHENMDKKTFDWIGDIKVEIDTLKPGTLRYLYNKMSSKGNKIGANSFRVKSAEIYTPGKTKHIELSMYYLKKKYKQENLTHFESNKIYLFGFLGHHEAIKGYNIALNGKKMLMRELRYKIYEPNPGTRINLRLGKGFRSAERNVDIEKGMLPRYFKFNLFKGVFSNNEINEHEWSFGEFLARILREEALELS